MNEGHKRSIAKAISWRTLGCLGTTLIVFIFTRRLALSIGIGVAELFVKMFLYYMHERAWSRIGWGRSKHPLEDLKIRKKLTSEDMDTIKQNLKDLGYMD